MATDIATRVYNHAFRIDPAVRTLLDTDFYKLLMLQLMWEIPALAIISELRARAAMRGMSRFDLDVLYARAKAKLWSKVERLRVLEHEAGPVKVSDFGARRRHGFLWQRWCVEAMQEGLGSSFIGTSNVKHAMDTGLEAVGTNAHELPMVYAAVAEDDEELLESPYRVLKDWAKMYGGNLLIVLPDCFGTTSFLNNAPDWVADWKGARPDSKPPIAGARELIAWWRKRGRDPREKLMVLSDAMDIDTIEDSVRALRGQVALSFGWGTNLTNDFTGCAPAGVDGQLKAISLVCKVVEADGRPAVKLSDNPNKALGPPEEVARYRRVFGTVGMNAEPVTV